MASDFPTAHTCFVSYHDHVGAQVCGVRQHGIKTKKSFLLFLDHWGTHYQSGIHPNLAGTKKVFHTPVGPRYPSFLLFGYTWPLIFLLHIPVSNIRKSLIVCIEESLPLYKSILSALLQYKIMCKSSLQTGILSSDIISPSDLKRSLNIIRDKLPRGYELATHDLCFYYNNHLAFFQYTDKHLYLNLKIPLVQSNFLFDIYQIEVVPVPIDQAS